MDNKKASLIIGSAFGTMVLLGGSLYEYQEGKIDALKDELYLKKQNEQRATDYYESTLNLKTIQSEFNTLKEYSVQKNCKINMNHKYNYTSDGMLGLKHEITLAGSGQLKYDINVRFDTAIISTSDNGKTIKIQLERPYVDEESIKLVENSLVMREQNYNFWSNKQDGAQAQKFFMDSFIESGRENIKDLYSTKDKRNYINKVAEAEVQALIRTFNLNNCNVIVEVLE